MRILRVALPVPLPGLFDYTHDRKQPAPEPGSRVVVPFGRRRLVGVVLEVAGSSELPESRLKSVHQVLDGPCLDRHLLELLQWCARYYCHPVGEVVSMALPGLLRRTGRRSPATESWYALTESGHQASLDRAPRQDSIRAVLQEGPASRKTLVDRVDGAASAIARMLEKGLVCRAEPPPRQLPSRVAGPELNTDQRHALAAILQARNHYQGLLLAGVTGSGKTEVYLQAARRALDRGRQVLLLLPEIGLTPQLVRRIEARLGEQAWTYHSGLNDSERLATWLNAASGKARVIVGTRSAVFMPLPEPGLFVIDEEHDGSFKQQDGPRYSGRDVAVMRANMLGIPIVLGSATPSLESLHNARLGRYRHLKLPERAGTARMARWRMLDLRGKEKLEGGLSPRVLQTIDSHLEKGGQVLIFRNRRGYAPVLLCTACGWQADCHQCSAHMTWHHKAGRLVCHHCGHTQRVPTACPDCGDPNLRGRGVGTERLEEVLGQRFPDYPVYRVDRDSMRGRDSFESLLETVRKGEACLLAGTQMLAKGHHLPGVTLAVVIDADQALFSADFRAPERLGQLLIQVSGRAGRGDREGEFVLQTLHPEHPWLKDLARNDYPAFAERLLEERKTADLPPYSALAMLRAEASRPETAQAFLDRALESTDPPEGIELAGPFPSVLARRAGQYRFQVWIQARERNRMTGFLQQFTSQLRALKSPRNCRWHVEVDPLSL